MAELWMIEVLDDYTVRDGDFVQLRLWMEYFKINE